MRITHILVPTDFSGSAREATDYAIDLARACQAKITLLHVIVDPVVYIPALGGYMPEPRDMEQFSETALAEWIASEDGDGLTIAREWIHGQPVDSILEVAKTRGCDLVVMGTHGRGLISHLLVGSVAERVVRRSRVPVLTVHPLSADEQGFDPSLDAVDG